MDDMIYWIWLSLACTPDTSTFPKLLERFSDARQIYEAEDYEIKAAIGSKSSDCHALCEKGLERAGEILEFCETKDVGLLCYGDENYPERLRKIPTPPVLLYYRGKLPNFNKFFGVAVVGTRSISDYGRKHSFYVSHNLALAGATIISGLAIGIDGVALAGALSASGQTVAVIGSGIDVCYPKEHLNLAREIVKEGCIFTEYAPGTKPNRYNFPQRNRIISGLSNITVVMEGKEKSGALITARHARKQGRPVFAFPGNVGNPNSEATNLLIKNGAALFTGPEDIVSTYELQPEGLGILNPFKLKYKIEVNMNEILKLYSVCAVAPSDNIFKKTSKKLKDNPLFSTVRIFYDSAQPQKPQKGSVKNGNKKEKDKTDTKTPDENTIKSFDKDQLAVYKKIPLEEECTIESLVCEGYDLRKVMRLLLKLEMNRFVILLPGDKVKRNNK